MGLVETDYWKLYLNYTRLSVGFMWLYVGYYGVPMGMVRTGHWKLYLHCTRLSVVIDFWLVLIVWGGDRGCERYYLIILFSLVEIDHVFYFLSYFFFLFIFLGSCE